MNGRDCLGRVFATLPFFLLVGCQPDSLASPACDLAPPASGTWTHHSRITGALASDGDFLLDLDLGCEQCVLSVLDAASGTWQALSTLDTDQSLEYGGTALASPGFFYVDVVANPNEQLSLVYDREESTWQKVVPPDDAHMTFRFWTGSHFLFWGGKDTENADLTPSQVAEDPNTQWLWFYDGVILDPSSGTWTKIPPARENARYSTSNGEPSVSATWSVSGLFVWGTNVERTANWGAVFDVPTMTWEPLLIGLDAPPVVEYAQLSSVGDDVFLYSGRPGRSASGTRSRGMWRFSLSQRTWSEVNVPRWADPQIGTVVDGHLAFMGRCVGGQLYDPQSDQWKPLAQEGVGFDLGVPRGAGRFLTVTNENDHVPTSHVWVIDLEAGLVP